MAKKENHMGFMSKLLSFGSDKDLKRYYKIVDQINGLEPQFEKMTEEELRGQTDKFRERYANGESLDDMLPEAFATVREASKRTMGMRHFDVQLIGAMALHEGHIAEMKTGEGKTLVSTLAGYLNAIAGKGVHVVTVNDYLAKRDSEWMGRIYKYLGMTVGLLQNNMPLELKRPAYQADVTYGTNSEFGFDYLRENLLRQRNPRMIEPMKEFEVQLRGRGLTPENAYLFMHGHTLMDNVVLIMLNTVCEKLRAMSIAKITASKKQGVALKNEMSNYTNSLRSIRDVLLDNENYTKSPLYKRLERDIERYIARTIWNMKRNGEIRDTSMIGIIHKLRTGQQ